MIALLPPDIGTLISSIERSAKDCLLYTSAAGYIGAQAVVGGIVKMFTQLREGVGSIVEFG